MKYILCYIICLLCLCVLVSCGSTNDTTDNNDNKDNNDSSTPLEEDKPVDLSNFEGIPDVQIQVDLERETKSSLFECVAIIKNNSEKSIKQLQLYLVKCRNGNDPLESNLYAERLLIKDFNNEERSTYRWILGNASGEEIEFKVYLAYVEYEDGTTWGLEKADHKTVVTRNVLMDVCVYDSSTITTKQTFEVIYSARVIANSHVGDNWWYGLENNGALVNPYTTVVVDVANNRGARFKIYAIEDDADDDYGSGVIRFPQMDIGETITLTQQVVVYENGGRYSGNKAYVLFTVTITRVGEEEE